VDNSDKEDNPNSGYIKKNYPKMKVHWAGENLGFAKANNIIIREAVSRGAEYVMLLNPDTVMEPDTVAKMAAALDNDSRLGSVSAKILKWDFENNLKTEIIDSCGMKMKKGLKFFDIGQNQRDHGQFDNSEILGPSGTAPMYRLKALERVKIASDDSPPSLPRRGSGGGVQYFDELMFMYKEDCDLNYRLKLAGYASRLVSEAKIYHDRSTSGLGESDIKVALGRSAKSRQTKAWAYLHQHIMFVKFWATLGSAGKLAALWHGLKMFVFVLIFEQHLLKEYINLFKIRKKITKYKK